MGFFEILMRRMVPGLLVCGAFVCSWAVDHPVRVVSEGPRGVDLKLDPVSFVVRADDQGRLSLEVPGFGQLREAGWPVLPRITALVALPSNSSPVLEVEEGPWRLISVQLDPWRPAPHEFATEPPPAPPGEVWPREAVRIAWTGRLRGQGVALVEFFPFRWDSKDRALLAASGLSARLNFQRVEDGSVEPVAPAGPGGDPLFEGVVSSLVVNPDHTEEGSASSSIPQGSSTVLQKKSDPLSESAFSDIAPVKLEVTRSGIYQVTGSDLLAAGVSLTRVDPRNLSLRNGGQPASIIIEGEEDGVFDPADTIIFYGEGVDTRFTDTSVYWLETDGMNALRMSTRDVTPGTAPLAGSFRNFVRKEESHIYTAPSAASLPDEHWWWERLDAPGNASFGSVSEVYRVNLANLPPAASQARLRFNVQGRSDRSQNPDHNTLLYVNGNLVDDQLWDGIISVVHDVLFNASFLVEGENIIKLELKTAGGASFASLYSNWFSLEYDDSHVSESDRLRFSIPAGSSLVEIESFSGSSISAYDVTDPIHPVRLTGGESVANGLTWTLRLEDSPSATWTYEAVTPGARQLPDAIIKDSPSSWRDPSNGADLILITHRDFSDAVEPLLDLRQSEGLRTAKVLVEDIVDEFSDGIYTPDAIVSFLTYAYMNWTRPAPAFVLLFGEANLDYRDFLGNGNNFVPTKLTGTLPGIGEVMTDNAFVRLDGSDLLPDMFVGRIAVRTAVEAQDVVNRIIDYSVSPPSAAVSDGVILLADDGASVFDPTFNNISDELATFVPATVQTYKIYASDFSSNGTIRSEIMTRVNAGAVVTNYIGHGNLDIWGAKLGSGCCFWRRSDVGSLSNGQDLTFTFALNCINGYFADFTRVSMGEHWLNVSGGGGIGGWTPSGLGTLSDYQVLGREVFRRVFQEHDSRMGSFTFNALIAGFTQFGIAADNMDELILFGDPSQHLATDLDLDGLLDRDELAAGTDPDDGDSDDDGVVDVDEPSWNVDTDGDGGVNALDYDSDDDGLPDGLEMGVTAPSASTDTGAGHFIADQDQLTTTHPLLPDTDGGGAPDGAEDRSADGQVDAGETDPLSSLDDPACAASAPREVTGLRLEKDGNDVVLTWDGQEGADPCVLYRVYVATDAGSPNAFSKFAYVGTMTQATWRHPSALTGQSRHDYLVTASSLSQGEGPLGHFGL